MTELTLTFLVCAGGGFITADRWLTRPRPVAVGAGSGWHPHELAATIGTAVFLSLALRALLAGMP